MSQIAQLKEELLGAKTVEFIANVLTEINAIKAKNIRQNFEKNRRFHEEISTVYHSIKLFAARHDLSLFAQKEPLKTTFIALTSNLRFYGNLNTNVMEKFVADATEEKVETADFMVIGQTGLDYLEARKLNLEVQPLRFKKDYPDSDEINFLTEKIREYGRIYLYYPKFINMVSQKVAVHDITQAVALEEVIEDKNKKVEMMRQNPGRIIEKMDIFEPEIEKIVEFFEAQVRFLLLIRTLLESELSRTAARLLAMSAAKERAQDLIKEKKMQFNKAKRSLENAKILETFAGMRNWGGVGR